jgi:hypothetical protein
MSYTNPDENYPDFFRLIMNVGAASGFRFPDSQVYGIIETHRRAMFARPVRRIRSADTYGNLLLKLNGVIPLERRAVS